jgi:hypothetical protein
MATIGQQLTAPESGYIRKDISEINPIFTGTSWGVYTGSIAPTSAYKGGFNYATINGDKVSFSIYCTTLRLIAYTDTSNYYASDVLIKIDGVSYAFSENIGGAGGTATDYQKLVFEKTGLSFGALHNIEIICTSKPLNIDCIDVDFFGYVFGTRKKSSPSDVVNPGDIIPSRYTSSVSGQVGNFSEFGTCTAAPIPVTSSATPNGLFYWVFVGYDSQNRKKFVADRNLQHSISWDTINTAGIASGEGLLLTPTINPNMTASTMDSYSVVSNITGTYAGWYAFSEVNNNGSQPLWEGAIPGYSTLDLGSVQTFQGLKYMMQSRWDSVSYAPKKWEVYISNNNVDWTLVNSQSEQTGWTASEKRYYDVQKSTISFRYIKFSILESVNGGIVDIQRIRIYDNSNDAKAIKLLTGGISSTNTDDEWDKIIVGSTLGGTITAGDNNIWNWNNVFSWTSSTSTLNTNAYRVYRGYASSDYYGYGQPTTTANVSYGFRPMLTVESTNGSPLISGLVKNITSKQFQLSGGTISDPELDAIKYQISIKKPDNSVVVKRAYDTSFNAPPIAIDSITLNASDFGIGTNTIIIDAMDAAFSATSWTTTVNKVSSSKVLLQDGVKWKYINSNSLVSVLDNYTTAIDSDKENAFLTYGMGTTINLTKDINNAIESPTQVKFVMLKIDLLN